MATKAEQEAARRQLEADEAARQAKSHGPAWKSGQTVDNKKGQR